MCVANINFMYYKKNTTNVYDGEHISSSVTFDKKKKRKGKKRNVRISTKRKYKDICRDNTVPSCDKRPHNSKAYSDASSLND